MESVGSIQPYEHDCDKCIWVSWFHPPSDDCPPGNIYYCPKYSGGTIIIRWSSEPSDYWSCPVGMGTKGSIGYMDHNSLGKDLALIEKRMAMWEEQYKRDREETLS